MGAAFRLRDDPQIAELVSLLDKMARNPAAVPGVLAQAQALAENLAQLPFGAQKIYAPGLSMPADKIIEVQNIPPVAGQDAEEAPAFQISRPGVVVGILAGARQGSSALGWLDYQILFEGSESMSFNGQSQPGFTSMLGHSPLCPWLPVLLPASGSSTWTIKVRNADVPANVYTPIMNFAFLSGETILRRCFERV